jgi:lysophospholipase L1-like esterase
MNTLFFIIILIILIIIINISNVYKAPLREFFDKKKKIILVGDSIFKNNNYASISVEDTIKEQYPDALILAEDNAVIYDAKNQLSQIGNNLDKSNTYIYISVGGNDILNHYHFSPKSNTHQLDKIYNAYVKLINSLRFKKANIVLTTIYFPPTYKEFHPLIRNWNKKLQQLSNEKGFELLPLHKYMKYKYHFVDAIEPSVSGSKIIANTIFRNANQ